MHKIITLLLIFSLNILGVAACKQSPSVSEITGIPNPPPVATSRVPAPLPTVLLRPTETRKPENAFPTHLVPTPLEVETTIFAVPDVPSGYIIDIYWDESSEIVFFNVVIGAGEQVLWAHDCLVETHTSQTLN